MVVTFYRWVFSQHVTVKEDLVFFSETPSHQRKEFLKCFAKCFYNLLYIHHQGCAYFCRAALTCPFVRASFTALVYQWLQKDLEVDLWGEATWDARHMHSLFKCMIHSPNHQDPANIKISILISWYPTNIETSICITILQTYQVVDMLVQWLFSASVEFSFVNDFLAQVSSFTLFSSQKEHLRRDLS